MVDRYPRTCIRSIRQIASIPMGRRIPGVDHLSTCIVHYSNVVLCILSVAFYCSLTYSFLRYVSSLPGTGLQERPS